MSERDPDNSLPSSGKAAGQNVIRGVRNRARMFVGNSIVRKTESLKQWR